MEFNCRRCNGTGTYLAAPCVICDGDGKIDLLDDYAMSHLTVATQNKLTGLIANEILIKIAELTVKVNDVMIKCNEIHDDLPGHGH